MYATASSVRSHAGQRGINVTLYLHGSADIPWRLSRNDVAVPPPDDAPAAIHTEVHRGGNFVESYLDVVAPDGSDRDTLTAAVTALAEKTTLVRAPMDGRPVWVHLQSGRQLGVRFYCGIPNVDPPTHLQVLWAALQPILEQDRSVQRPTLVIHRRLDSDYLRMWLARESLDVVQQAMPEFAPTILKIDHETRGDLELAHGPIEELAPELLLPPNLTAEQLFGKVEFVDEELRR